jgi:hypothetical protein
MSEERANGNSSPLPCSAPWAGSLHHARGLCDDWGMIRDDCDNPIIRVCLPLSALSEDALSEHRRNETDPTQERVDYILAVLNGQNVGGEQ